MSDYSLFNVAIQAEQLRNAQKAYEQQENRWLHGVDINDLKLTQEFFKVKSNLEISFDDTIAQIINSK